MDLKSKLLCVGLLHVAFAGCSSEDSPTVVPSGGSSSTGTAGSGGTTAGTSSSGGMAGASSTSGGTSGGKAGAAGSGGTAGSSGNASAGAAGTAGAGGAAGSGGAPTEVTIEGLDGMLVQTPCKPTDNNDCDSKGWVYKGQTRICEGGKLDTDLTKNAEGKALLTFPVKGEAGKHYQAKMHFYGIMEPFNYGGNVQREFGTERPIVQNNPSEPAPFATAAGGAVINTSDYNTYELHSYDNNGQEIKQYFINSDLMQGHYTFAISYERDIEVVGGGSVRVRVYDSNCRMIKNCGTNGSVHDCSGEARSVSIASADPQPQAVGGDTLNQPGLGTSAADPGQWFLIDVKTIVPAP